MMFCFIKPISDNSTLIFARLIGWAICVPQDTLFPYLKDISEERPWRHSACQRINAAKRIICGLNPRVRFLNVCENTEVTRAIKTSYSVPHTKIHSRSHHICIYFLAFYVFHLLYLFILCCFSPSAVISFGLALYKIYCMYVWGERTDLPLLVIIGNSAMMPEYMEGVLLPSVTLM